MKVLIIEDEITAVNKLKRLLKQVDPEIDILNAIESVEASVNWLIENPSPDLIFMDIQLTDGISFEIFDSKKIETPIIFCTAYDKYAIQAFKVNSIDYLLKPYEKEDLENAINKFKKISDKKSHELEENIEAVIKFFNQEKEIKKTRFLVKVGKKLNSITIEKISHFYTEDKLAYLVTHENKRYPVDYSLEALEISLPGNDFFRINRQYILSHKTIKTVESEFGKIFVELNVPTKNILTISRDRVSDFKRWLDK